MWIRLESSHNGSNPVGVYQDFDYYFLNDFCRDSMLLPVPQEYIEDENCCSCHFWFTELGWREYGTWFSGLFEPEARQMDDCAIYASIITDTDMKNFHPYYIDDFQVALCYEETINVTAHSRLIKSLDDWKQFERDIGLL